jgi:hypothetical protein
MVKIIIPGIPKIICDWSLGIGDDLEFGIWLLEFYPKAQGERFFGNS